MDLAEDLANREDGCQQRAALNYFWRYSLLLVSALSSSAAALLVALDLDYRVATAVLAAAPGLVVALDRSFRFEERWRWWVTKQHKMNALGRELSFEQRDEKQVSKELTAFLVRHEELWPSFGHPPSSHAPDAA